jgi:hypothetical protein
VIVVQRRENARLWSAPGHDSERGLLVYSSATRLYSRRGRVMRRTWSYEDQNGAETCGGCEEPTRVEFDRLEPKALG